MTFYNLNNSYRHLKITIILYIANNILFLGVITGFIVMGVAFIVAQSSGVIDASQLMTSATSGPLLGVFVLAMFFPSTNWKVST